MSFTRRFLQVIAFIATLVVGATSMAVIVTQTTWFKEWLRGFIVRQAADYVNGQLSIGKLDGNLFHGVALGDVDVTVDGEKVVDVDDISLDYNVFTFIRGDVVLDEIRLTRPVLHLQRDADGWNLAHLIKARTPDPDKPKNRRTLEIGEIAISRPRSSTNGQAKPITTAKTSNCMIQPSTTNCSANTAAPAKANSGAML